MRLICPNCGAQYEVADDVIPTDGRDVQCSNCGHTWFESHGASDIEDAFSDIADPAFVEDDLPDMADRMQAPDTSPPAAPKMDPAIADILREEAAREAEARRREADTMESQPDLGLDSAAAAPDQRTIETQRRMATLKGEDVTITAQAATRRELLPDIEEINSSLRSEAERETPADAPAPVETRNRKSFRIGFFGVLLILAILTALYVFAPQISETIPALAGALDSYVTTVDQARLWVDLKLQTLVATMTGDTA